MVVAVVAVGVVEVAIDEIVHVVAVGDRFVATPRAVVVVLRVLATVVSRGTRFRVGTTDRQSVLLDHTAGYMVQVTIVEIIGVAVVLDRRVAAGWPMLMVVLFVVFMCHWIRLPFGEPRRARLSTREFT